MICIRYSHFKYYLKTCTCMYGRKKGLLVQRFVSSYGVTKNEYIQKQSLWDETPVGSYSGNISPHRHLSAGSLILKPRSIEWFFYRHPSHKYLEPHVIVVSMILRMDSLTLLYVYLLLRNAIHHPHYELTIPDTINMPNIPNDTIYVPHTSNI